MNDDVQRPRQTHPMTLVFESETGGEKGKEGRKSQCLLSVKVRSFVSIIIHHPSVSGSENFNFHLLPTSEIMDSSLFALVFLPSAVCKFTRFYVMFLCATGLWQCSNV